MLTIFATPKAFQGQFSVIQENAVASWTKLKPGCQIILLGNDYGTKKIAKKYGILHIPNIAVNKYGTPLLPDLFKKAYKRSKFPILAYVNCDIILTKDFIEGIKKINLPKFFLTGARKELKITHSLDFENNWQNNLKAKVLKEGELVLKDGATDYFVFRPKIDFKMPNLILGRTFWDAWLIFQAKYLKIPIIDATNVIWAIHQTHNYSHAGGWNNVWLGPESKINLKLIGDRRKIFNTKDADFVLTQDGLKKPNLTISRIVRKIETAPIFTPEISLFLYPFNFFIKVCKFTKDQARMRFKR
ncbi:hypothetical protein HYW46_05975 [Candidatus Daviesbacteria bacterium]|nr:hypothetical protein [Candidatus Daviesbacteria bacterium]